MRLTALPFLFLAPYVSAYNQQKPLQIYLHPTPTNPSSQSAPTLTADQAKAVLSHHLGENIGDFEEIPSDEGLWGHLVSMWNGEESGAGEGRKAKVVVIEGGVMPQDVLPTSLSSSPSFYLEEDTPTRALLAPYLQRASHLLDNILKYIPSLAKTFKDTFELAGTKAAATLEHELSCLTALADSIPWLDHSSHSYPWEAISITGLGHVDRHDEIWEAGAAGVKAGLAAMTAPDSPPLLLIIVPSTDSHISTRSPRSMSDILQRAENQTLAQSCYTSNASCNASTECYGRGTCALKLTTANGECWGCKCASGYAGVECQKEDYSIPFVILVFSTVLLLGLLVGSVALLMTVGDTKLPSTLTLAVGGHVKRD